MAPCGSCSRGRWPKSDAVAKSAFAPQKSSRVWPADAPFIPAARRARHSWPPTCRASAKPPPARWCSFTSRRRRSSRFFRASPAWWPNGATWPATPPRSSANSRCRPSSRWRARSSAFSRASRSAWTRCRRASIPVSLWPAVRREPALTERYRERADPISSRLLTLHLLDPFGPQFPPVGLQVRARHLALLPRKCHRGHVRRQRPGAGSRRRIAPGTGDAAAVERLRAGFGRRRGCRRGPRAVSPPPRSFRGRFRRCGRASPIPASPGRAKRPPVSATWPPYWPPRSSRRNTGCGPWAKRVTCWSPTST